MPLRVLTPAEVAQYRDEGWLRVPQLFDAAEIAALREGFGHVESLASNPSLAGIYRRAGSGTPRVHIHIQQQGSSGGGGVRRCEVLGGNAVPGPTPPPLQQPEPGPEPLPVARVGVSGGATAVATTQLLRKVNWPAHCHPSFERIRNSPKWPALLEPLLGTAELSQFINQINFKNPGGAVEYPWHQDVRDADVVDPLRTYVQTYLLVDRATAESGALWIVPRSHRRGQRPRATLSGNGAVLCGGEPGDVLLWSTYTVHGSARNMTSSPRRSYINGFLVASAARSARCVRAFKADGVALALEDDGWDYTDLMPRKCSL
jgi:hypothetical protein